MLRPLPQPASRIRACSGRSRSLMTRFSTVRRPRYHQCRSSARWVCSSYARSIRPGILSGTPANGSHAGRSAAAVGASGGRFAPLRLALGAAVEQRGAQELDGAPPCELGGLALIRPKPVRVVEESVPDSVIGVRAHVDAGAAHLLLEGFGFVQRDELILACEVGEDGTVDARE